VAKRKYFFLKTERAGWRRFGCTGFKRKTCFKILPGLILFALNVGLMKPQRGSPPVRGKD